MLEILNVFNTLKPIFLKPKTFFKKLEYNFLVLGLKSQHFHTSIQTLLNYVGCVGSWVDGVAWVRGYVGSVGP